MLRGVYIFTSAYTLSKMRIASMTATFFSKPGQCPKSRDSINVDFDVFLEAQRRSMVLPYNRHEQSLVWSERLQTVGSSFHE